MAGSDVTGQGSQSGEGRAWQGTAGQGRLGQGKAGQDMAGQCRAGQGKGEGSAKDNAGHSALQEKAKDITDCAKGGGQGRADYK